MKLDLLPVINADGKVIEIDEKLDFSDKHMQGVIFLSPLHICGTLANIGGTIELNVSASGRVQYECDRCCEDYEDDLNFEISEILKKENSDEDTNPDVLYFKGFSADFDEIVLNNAFMNIPSKKLCKDSCRGLCPSCGKNLNFGDCGCDTRPTDPRFDILDKFFE